LSEGRLAEIGAAVLLGGGSRRMGTDKAALELEGLPVATRTARLLAGLFEEVLLVGGAPPPGAPGRRVEDQQVPRCALRGWVGALAAARSPRVLVVATDLPCLSAELLLALVAFPEADVVLPRSPGGLEPLCALYRRERVLPRARERLAAGPLALHGLLGELELGILAGAELTAVDPDGTALENVNTPAAFARVRARLAEDGRCG
jgi:molybdenum cofactor guanylyltransferase